jgi:hypothetical protein
LELLLIITGEAFCWLNLISRIPFAISCGEDRSKFEARLTAANEIGSFD